MRTESRGARQAGIPAAIQGYTLHHRERGRYRLTTVMLSAPLRVFCHHSVADSDLHQLKHITIDGGDLFVVPFTLDRGC